MTVPSTVRCAIYTRKSSEEGLEQSFNSLDAQREACEAYILSQRHEGWQVVSTKYDDGGFSGGTIERPALKRLLDDIAAGRVNTVVVYKVDRLTRSLADFAKIVEQFDQQGVSFVSVTQQFNTTSSMGRLTLNVLLSFAQFEREVTGERIRDKIAASKKKGMWMGGVVPLGYDLQDHKLILNPQEAAVVQAIFKAYLDQGCVSKLWHYLKHKGISSKKRISKTGNTTGGNVFSRGSLYEMLQNRIYRGEIPHKDVSYPGQHAAIIDQKLWDRVQAQFKANLQAKQTRPRSTQKSLLVGLLYDSRGNRFTPSHTNKKGRRYRYYTSQAVIKKSAKGEDGTLRLPAEEIEDLVTGQIKGLLQSPQRLLELLGNSESSAEETQRLLEAVATTRDHVEDLVPTVIHRVIVYDDRLEVQVSKMLLLKHLLGADAAALETPAAADDIFTLEVSAILKRHGGEVRFQLAPDTPGIKPHPVSSLVHALARSHDWVEKIMRGELVNQRTIAMETGFDERYVSRIMPLAFLSPDLTEAILDGKTTSYASLGDWVADIPGDWAQQRNAMTVGQRSDPSET